MFRGFCLLCPSALRKQGKRLVQIRLVDCKEALPSNCITLDNDNPAMQRPGRVSQAELWRPSQTRGVLLQTRTSQQVHFRPSRAPLWKDRATVATTSMPTEWQRPSADVLQRFS